MAKNDKDEVVTVDEVQTVEDTATTTEPTTPVGFIAADQGEPETTDNGSAYATLGYAEPTETATDDGAAKADDTMGVAGAGFSYFDDPKALRIRALELATVPAGIGGTHHEPINSVLARAEAYRLFMDSGTLPTNVA